MMPGILIGGADASGKKVDLAYIDYGSLITWMGTLAQVNLPEKLEPRAYGDEMFGFEFARVTPSPLGIELSADAVLQTWQGLENEGMPLQEVVLGLIVADIVNLVRGIPAQTPGHVHHYYGSMPSFASMVQLVGHIAEIRAFPQNRYLGFDYRVSELRKNLKGILKHGTFCKKPWPELPKFLSIVREAGTAVSSKESEFNVLRSYAVDLGKVYTG